LICVWPDAVKDGCPLKPGIKSLGLLGKKSVKMAPPPGMRLPAKEISPLLFIDGAANTCKLLLEVAITSYL
ncbi:hypothetical protein OFC18_31795, partial [Escherichia coli]|nr:hypothetical protein [Escherichia coli]